MQIKINDFIVRTKLGVFDWEKEHPREIVINLTINFDGSKACKTDDLRDTVDYFALTQQILDTVQPKTYNLIETLAQEILDIIMTHKLVQSAEVRVDKPGFPRFAKSASIICAAGK